jgi:hypothetical protein
MDAIVDAELADLPGEELTTEAQRARRRRERREEELHGGSPLPCRFAILYRTVLGRDRSAVLVGSHPRRRGGRRNKGRC